MMNVQVQCVAHVVRFDLLQLCLQLFDSVEEDREWRREIVLVLGGSAGRVRTL